MKGRSFWNKVTANEITKRNILPGIKPEIKQCVFAQYYVRDKKYQSRANTHKGSKS